MAIRCHISSTSCLGANVLYIYNVLNISVIYSSKYDVMNHINNVVNNLDMSNLPIVSAIYHVFDGDLSHIYITEKSAMIFCSICAVIDLYIIVTLMHVL